MIIIRNRIDDLPRFCAKLRFGGKTGSRHRFRFVESLRLPSTMAVIFENRRRIVLRRQHRAEPWFFCVEKTDAGKVRRESDKIDISQATRSFFTRPCYSSTILANFPPPERPDPRHGKTFVLSCSNCKLSSPIYRLRSSIRSTLKNLS